MMNVQKHVSSYRFDELFSQTAVIQSVKSVTVQNESETDILTISSYSRDPNKGMFIACPQGGATFAVNQTLRHEAGQLVWKSRTAQMQIQDTLSVHAKRIELATTAMTLISDKLQLQSSIDPFEIHSFANHRQALALRCPKGGISFASGDQGIMASTSGNIDLHLDNPQTNLRLASRGHNKHTIYLGNDASETIVANQLTVRGKLVLSDDSIIEKHRSTVRELQNVVRLTCDGVAADSGFDYGFVSNKPDGSQSGLIYDHQRNRFYFSTQLGSYKHKRFSLPQSYADVQASSFLAQKKVVSPFVDATTIKCNSIRNPRDLLIQTPKVHCSQHLSCVGLTTNTLVANTNMSTKSLQVDHETMINGRMTAKQMVTYESDVVLGKGEDKMILNSWLWNTVGPHGRHRTLQAFCDADEAAPTTDPRGKSMHVVMEATGTTHNCNATLTHPRILIDGRHSTFTGNIELTQDCEHLLIVDACISHFALSSSIDEDKTETRPKPITIVLRNVHGHAKDWAFDLPEGRLILEHCDIEFQNIVLGTLEQVVRTNSVVRGSPWRQLKCIKS